MDKKDKGTPVWVRIMISVFIIINSILEVEHPYTVILSIIAAVLAEIWNTLVSIKLDLFRDNIESKNPFEDIK